MSYEPTTWRNDETAVNAANMNKLEQGVAAAHEDISGLQSSITALSNRVNGKFVTFGDTVTLIPNQYVKKQYTDTQIQSIFGTTDKSKIYIIALDMLYDNNTWSRQAATFGGNWYEFPRYDLWVNPETAGIYMSFVFAGLGMTENMTIPFRVLAFVAD